MPNGVDSRPRGASATARRPRSPRTAGSGRPRRRLRRRRRGPARSVPASTRDDVGVGAPRRILHRDATAAGTRSATPASSSCQREVDRLARPAGRRARRTRCGGPASGAPLRGDEVEEPPRAGLLRRGPAPAGPARCCPGNRRAASRRDRTPEAVWIASRSNMISHSVPFAGSYSRSKTREGSAPVRAIEFPGRGEGFRRSPDQPESSRGQEPHRLRGVEHA